MKTGRNDPCPCGSGKKFKHCCARVVTAPAEPEDKAWQQLHRMTLDLPAELLKTARSHFGQGGIDEAWQEFNHPDIEEEPFDPDTPHMPVFAPWFLYHWTPDPAETRIAAAAHGVTAAQAYLNRKAHRLDPLVRRYIESCLKAVFSFHEVVRCNPGRGMRLRDAQKMQPPLDGGIIRELRETLGLEAPSCRS